MHYHTYTYSLIFSTLRTSRYVVGGARTRRLHYSMRCLCNNVHFVRTLAASVIINARHSRTRQHKQHTFALNMHCSAGTIHIMCSALCVRRALNSRWPVPQAPCEYMRDSLLFKRWVTYFGTQHVCTIPSRTNDEFADVCLPCVCSCIWSALCWSWQWSVRRGSVELENQPTDWPTDRPTDKPTDNRLHKWGQLGGRGSGCAFACEDGGWRPEFAVWSVSVGHVNHGPTAIYRTDVVVCDLERVDCWFVKWCMKATGTGMMIQIL